MSLQLAVAVAGTSGKVLPGHLKKGSRQAGGMRTAFLQPQLLAYI